MPPDESLISKDKDGFHFNRGHRFGWWAFLFLPFLIVFKILYKVVKEDVNWKAAWATVLLFELLFIPTEWYHLQRGHWVYNEAKILGPKIFGLPIEEPLLYMLFSPLIIISIFHAVKQKVQPPKEAAKQ